MHQSGKRGLWIQWMVIRHQEYPDRFCSCPVWLFLQCIAEVICDQVEESPSTGKISLGLSVIVRVTLKDGTFHEVGGDFAALAPLLTINRTLDTGILRTVKAKLPRLKRQRKRARQMR